MSRIRSKNTKPEKIIFSALRKRKIYFQKYYKKAAGCPDIALPRKQIAVFIDGDFWHGFHFVKNKSRLPEGYWIKKIESNIARDKRIRTKLKSDGWQVLRIWEHEIENDPTGAANSVIEFLKQKHDNQRSSR